jgi:late competence protein required for DNA uptake (superfamily II DNA/RNA helicase)
MALISTCPHCGNVNLNSLWSQSVRCLYCNSIYEVNRIKPNKFKKE